MNPDEASPFGCPKCHSFAIYRSRPRGLIERVRKHFTALRPYRCHSCEWRGWLLCIRYVKYPLPELSRERRNSE
jgi:predicted RNA-binding Zn-ribbon protein involved in translation (DUF1610 family)